MLLKDENVSSKGEFNSFANITSLPRPTQKPHPPFWIAATNTPETFAFAGTNGCKVMAIPLEPHKMRDLIGTYRDAWRAAGHPGNGHVMNTFFMCCAPTRDEAMAMGLGPCNAHLKGLADAAKEWLTGASTKDYPGYDKLMAHVLADSAEKQVAAGSAFIGTPADIVEMIAQLQRQGRRHRQRVAALHAGQHAGRDGGALAAAVLERGDAEGGGALATPPRWRSGRRAAPPGQSRETRDARRRR